jgi:hypothetical protein
MNNYALARPGDKVSVNGWYLHKGRGIANRLLVRAAQPLGSEKKERIAASPKERKQSLDVLNDISAGDAATTPKSNGENGANEAPKPEEQN